MYVPSPSPISSVRELIKRSEQSYKEKSYPTQSITLQDEESLEMMMRTSRVMKTMSWMTTRMMMREALIWEMRRRLDLPRRKPRLVRLLISVIRCRQSYTIQIKGICRMLVRAAERRQGGDQMQRRGCQ